LNNTKKDILWESSPSKEACKIFKTFFIMIFTFSIFLLIAIEFSFLIIFNFDEFILNPLRLLIEKGLLIFFILTPVFGGLYVLLYFLLIKPIFIEKWKYEHYIITKNSIICQNEYKSPLMSESIQSEVLIDDFEQFRVYNDTYMSKRKKMDVKNVRIYTKSEFYPKLLFYYIENYEKLVDILINLLAVRRLKQLKEQNKLPIQDIKWERESKLKYAFICLLGRVVFTVLIFTIIGLYISLILNIDIFFEELSYGILNQFLFTILIFILISLIISIYHFYKFLKYKDEKILITNKGIFNLKTNELILKLDEIKYFFVYTPFIIRIFKKELPTISIFKELKNKPAVKIHLVKNYKELIDALTDKIYVKKLLESKHGKFELIMPFNQIETIHKQEKLQEYQEMPISQEVQLNIESNELNFVRSYLQKNEKILKIIKPEYKVYRNKFILSLSPIIVLFVVISVIFFIIDFIFTIKYGSEMSFISITMFILLLITIFPILVCTIISQIIMLKKLKNSIYILTNQKIIIKFDKNIQFIPYNKISSIIISKNYSKLITKKNVSDITISLMKPKMIKGKSILKKGEIFNILYCVKNGNEIKDYILNLKKIME